MSVVTGIIVICGCAEDETHEDGPPVAFERLNDWIEEHHGLRPLKPLEDSFGGNKHPQLCMAGTGMNCFDEDGFAKAFLALEWCEPGRALLIMQPEEGETRVVRPDDRSWM